MLARSLVGSELAINIFGQYFAELYAPLIERIKLPNGALDEYFVLVEGDELAKSVRRELRYEQRSARVIAGKGFMRHEIIRYIFGAHLIGGFAESEGFCLGQHVRDELEVVLTQWI